MDWLKQDLRYAVRTLGRSPGFTAVAITTLALAVGATTAVFTVVDSVLLKPLPYPDASRLVLAWERVPRMSNEPGGPNVRHVDIWRKRSTAFSDLILLRHSTNGLAIGLEHPQLVGTVTSEPNLFAILGVSAFMGRTFVPEDAISLGRDGGVHAQGWKAIITYGLWQRAFQSDPGVIGRTVRIADIPREIVGVLPSAFQFPNANALRPFRSGQLASNVPEPSVFLAVMVDPTASGWNGDYGNWVALGRLKPDVSIERAGSQLAAAEAEVVQLIPPSQRGTNFMGVYVTVQRLQDAVVQDAKRGLWLLMASVVGLMLMACLNLANAQIGRALSRRRESGVRIALGASRSRLVMSVLSESAVLAAAGSACGILLALASVRLFRLYSPIDLPRLGEVHANGAVLVFSVCVGVLTMLLSGLLPVLTVLRSDARSSLRESDGRTISGRGSHKIRTWLIGFQIAGCTVLLLLTGLFAQSLVQLLREDKGFDSSNVAVAEVRVAPPAFATAADRARFDDAVLMKLRQISGVQSAGLVSAMPLEGETWIDGLYRADRPIEQGVVINVRWVSPGYFETMRERIVAGRSFEERDRNLQSAVLSEGVAKALFGSDDPIGGEVKRQNQTFRVIGVVADSRNTSLKTVPARVAYFHYVDTPPYVAFFSARGSQSPAALISSMRQAIWNQAPEVTIARVTALEEQVTQSLASERFQTVVLVAFGVSALLLAMLGVYGVLTYSVAARRQEIGLRMALGATSQRIYSLTFREAGRPLAAGVGLGLAASVLGQMVVLKTVYGIQGVHPLVIFGVMSLLVVSAGVAAFPALRRAASVDPMTTLRAD